MKSIFFPNLNHKYGQLLNAERKFRPTDQSANMTLEVSRESNNENVSPRNFDSEVNPEDFTREQAQAINSYNTEYNLIDKNNDFFYRFENGEAIQL